jgi:outer membrane protein
MTSKFSRFILAAAILLATSALAQTSSTPASGSPATVATSAPAPAPAPNPVVLSGTKVGALNIEGAVFGSNEGRRELEALQKKFEPKNTELKSQNDELEALKKQLSTQGPSLNDDAAANLKKQIEGKQKTFDRNYQDFQEEVGNQQQEIFTRILGKMAPMILKYAQDNGYGMIVDTSKQWPQGPVLIAGPGLDITQAVIDSYNAQSSVPAPATTGGAKPSAPKPAAPKATAPQSTTPPK